MGLAEAIIGHDRRKRVGHLGRGQEITAADCEPIEIEVARGEIEQALAEEAALEAPRCAIRARRRLVAHHRVRRDAQVRHAIWPGEELRHVAHRRGAVRPHIGADVDEDVAANAADRAVVFERDFHIAFGLARVGDRHEMLAPVLDPLDRVTEAARGKRHQEILRVEFAACAKSAADVVFDVVDRGLRQLHHGGQRAAIEERQLGSARHGELGTVPLGEKPAGLHRERGEALHAKRLPPHVRRIAERSSDVAHLRHEGGRAIAACSRKQQRRRGNRGCAVNNRGQRRDIESDCRCGVLGLLRRIGKHHRNWLAHVAHDFARDDRLRVRCGGRIWPTERDRRNFRPDIGRGDDRAHASHGPRRAIINAAQPAVRNRAANERGMPLPRPRKIVEIAASPAQQAQILGPLDRRPDIGVGALTIAAREDRIVEDHLILVFNGCHSSAK